MLGELRNLALMLALTGAAIWLLDWVQRNAAEALGDEAPGKLGGGWGRDKAGRLGNKQSHISPVIARQEPPL